MMAGCNSRHWQAVVNAGRKRSGDRAMNVMFVVPPEQHFIESYVTRKLDKGREFRQKLGIMYVAGALRDSTGIIPRIVDCLADGYNLIDLKALVRRERPDLVGFSALTFNLLDCLEAAAAIKEASPDTKICFGGFHVSIYPTETLNLPNVDYVVIGEGEITFPEFIKCLMSSDQSPDVGALRKIDGLGFCGNEGNAVINKSRKPVIKLDELPMPAHDLIDISKYTVVLADEASAAAIQTSRGCPSRCIFCDIRMTRYRYRSEENVLKEIKALKDMGVREFFFLDDTFTINRKRVIRLCELLIREKVNIRYKVSSRIDRMDDEMLAYLARSGCYRIHYGIESGSQRMLDFLQKEITVDQIERIMGKTRKAGIEVFAYMMIGIPTETREDMEKSFQLIRRIMPDHVNYSICTPFPATHLYKQALEKGMLEYDYWLEFARNPNPGFKICTLNEHFNESELRHIQDKAIRHFYSSPRVIVREILYTKSLKQLMVKARMGLRLLIPRFS